MGCLGQLACTSALDDGANASILVLALDCEIHIPGHFTVQTQDRGSVAFFSPQPNEGGRIVILQDGEDDVSIPDFRTVSTRSAGHLKITHMEYTQFDPQPLSVVEIRSEHQRLFLYGDAAEREISLVDDCVASFRDKKARGA
jgi:hypothetical protein